MAVLQDLKREHNSKPIRKLILTFRRRPDPLRAYHEEIDRKIEHIRKQAEHVQKQAERPRKIRRLKLTFKARKQQVSWKPVVW